MTYASPTLERRNATLDDAVNEARLRFGAQNPASLSRHESAQAFLPGGNTRAVMWYPPFPLTLAGGDGCMVQDIDGHRYVDFVSEYTAGLYGHSDKTIEAALITAIKGGILLGSPNQYEAKLAEAIVSRFPAIERVRFCNSGTEANIMALSTARAVTGRKKIVAMHDGYHGGVLTFAHGGSPLNLPFPFLFATYNDVEGTRSLLRAEGKEIAAVILEPMMGAGGCIAATPEFLHMLREVTREIGAFLIFDEVMTSRLHYRGLHGKHGLSPDLVTLGKYLGGGASFGAFGGRADIMDHFDPAAAHAFSHGGTFNNNVMSMAAGHAGLTHVLTEEASRRVNTLGDKLRIGINECLARRGVSGAAIGVGSLMALHFAPGNVQTPADLEHQDSRCLALYHMEMMLRGFHVTPRGMLALSLPMRDEHVTGFLAAFDDFLEVNQALLPRAQGKSGKG